MLPMNEVTRPLEIFQMSWVVCDLEEAARRWHRTTGVGPFLINRHISITEPLYRGAPGPVDFSTAIAQAGPVQVELVQQHDHNPSCYRDSVPEEQEGMHHVAVMADDYDAEIRRYTQQGFAIASSGSFAGVRFSYVDCRDTLGHMVEVLESGRAISKFFGAIRKAAEEWDGDEKTLLREL